tara:strand:+ start:207 stop:1043 length:837 start_codon:yes stop_codon:yes gene_type:complete
MAEELSNLVETLSIDDKKENNTTESQVRVEEKEEEKKNKPRLKRGEGLKIFEQLFTPDKDGKTKRILREELYNTRIALTSNGNMRHNRPPWDPKGKYIYYIEKEGVKVIAITAIGFSNSETDNHPISATTKEYFKKNYKYCLNCGTHSNLVIDHKNDLYNNKRILDTKSQKFYDFQRLCNKCNNHLKHSTHERERKSGKLHKARDVGKFQRDNFDYPWEKALTEYKEIDEEGNKAYIQEERHCCKYYTYWYDIEAFENRREWYLLLRKVNYEILKKIK